MPIHSNLKPLFFYIKIWATTLKTNTTFFKKTFFFKKKETGHQWLSPIIYQKRCPIETNKGRGWLSL